MSMDWFRSWHGAPTDPKWLLIAKRSETQAGIVSAIVWAMFDYASQNADDRGNVEAFDAETYSAFSGFEEATIRRVIDELKDKKIIIDGHLSAWEKRQTKREDNSTPRVQKHRNAKKHNETQETSREDKTREDKKESCAVAKATRPKFEYSKEFEEAWQVYPKRDGGNPKPPAAKLFLAAVKAGEDAQAIIDGVKRFAIAESRNIGTPYIPQMVKWLRDKRWLDYTGAAEVVKFDIRRHLV